MAAKNQNFEMFAGDTKTITVTVASTNLSGSTVKWAMKKSIYNAEPDVYKDTTAGITVPDAGGGVFVIALEPEDTAQLSGEFYHEAEVTDNAGNVSTVLTGKATINLSGV